MRVILFVSLVLTCQLHKCSSRTDLRYKRNVEASVRKINSEKEANLQEPIPKKNVQKVVRPIHNNVPKKERFIHSNVRKLENSNKNVNFNLARSVMKNNPNVRKPIQKNEFKYVPKAAKKVPGRAQRRIYYEKPASIKWDYSDFALKFLRRVPELKIRRAPPSSVGEPWPMPQLYTKGKQLFRIDISNFTMRIASVRCDIIEKAVSRYHGILRAGAGQFYNDNMKPLGKHGLDGVEEMNLTNAINTSIKLDILSIHIERPCTKYPDISSDESYTLMVKPVGAFIKAKEVWGALRGLETFSQVLFQQDEVHYIWETVINDFPRFPHRGVLIDSSRHYIKKEVMFDVMNGMVMNKMNVFHWHIVDDQSFPYQSQIFPNLSGKGAYHPSLIYTFDDIREIIEYGRLRGIRIIPEFDTPGHSFSWGFGHPELLTQCYDSLSNPIPGFLGPMNPSQNSTFEFLAKFFKEAIDLFPGNFFHIGGDEVPTDCWQTNPEIRKFAKYLSDLNEKEDDDTLNNQMALVVEYFIQRLSRNITDIGSKSNRTLNLIAWEEVFKNGINVSESNMIINIWLGKPRDVGDVTLRGFHALYSSCWYLDHVDYGVQWPKYYTCDPTGMGFQGKEDMVLGGEACLWSEYITNNDVIRLLWPRASAVAERLWSHKGLRDVDQASRRLQEHRCRMFR